MEIFFVILVIKRGLNRIGYRRKTKNVKKQEKQGKEKWKGVVYHGEQEAVVGERFGRGNGGILVTAIRGLIWGIKELTTPTLHKAQPGPYVSKTNITPIKGKSFLEQGEADL